jgi:hypothetical protein
MREKRKLRAKERDENHKKIKDYGYLILEWEPKEHKRKG